MRPTKNTNKGEAGAVVDLISATLAMRAVSLCTACSQHDDSRRRSQDYSSSTDLHRKLQVVFIADFARQVLPWIDEQVESPHRSVHPPNTAMVKAVHGPDVTIDTHVTVVDFGIGPPKAPACTGPLA
ncbi:hypothetical protein ACFVT5_13780 [Streptomyces sp. NPDC058001]|uniref:hypothetical protein n=1 Tax=Streptomyces sp. NPDC058001 TaxID=3346300 RepID=UPI0036F03CC3